MVSLTYNHKLCELIYLNFEATRGLKEHLLPDSRDILHHRGLHQPSNHSSLSVIRSNT